ncbi:MAG: HisA/HisF-related TIM barrel protein, partial [Woeseiaceae bacterium]
MNVIPAIDLKDGRCVRLMQGDFDQETHYSNEPVDVAHRYRSLGFDRLHLVDLDGARSGEQKHAGIVANIVSSTDMMVQVGGGIRGRDSIARWLEAGVS